MTPIVLGGAAPLPQSFVLNVGDLVLAEYLRVSPGEGFDPSDPDYSTPQFSSSPLREGGTFVLDNVGLREKVWPLVLKAIDKPTLHEVIRDINRELERPQIRVEWKDAGIANSTFYDVVRGRLEVEFNFRRGQHSRANATLRIWVQPFGHTATERIAATAAAVGAAPVRLPVASVAGDADAELLARVAASNASYWRGQLVGHAVLPASQWQAWFPAASLAPLGGASRSGASGAPGSQYIVASRMNVPAPIAAATLAVPSAHHGLNRLLAYTRHNYNSAAGHHLSVDGKGATGYATAAPDKGWSLTDLGTIWVDGDSDPVPLTISAAQHLASSGLGRVRSGGLVYDIDLAGLLVLPEDRTALIVDSPYAHICSDDFDPVEPRYLFGQPADGGVWASGPLQSASGAFYRDSFPIVLLATSAVLTRSSGRLALDTPAEDLLVEAEVGLDTILVPASHMLAIGKTTEDLKAWSEARVYGRPSPALHIVVGGDFSTNGSAIATVPLADAGSDRSLTFLTQGPVAYARHRVGATLTTLTASHAYIRRAGEPHVALTSASSAAYNLAGKPGIYWMRAGAMPSLARGASPAYVFSASQPTLRTPTARGRSLAMEQRGAAPNMPPPAGELVVFSSGIDTPADTCTVQVSVRDRFRFAR